MEDEMRKKMAKFGFQDNQIEAMLHPRRGDRLPAGALPDNPIIATASTAIATVPYRPTFVKIHKDYIDVETLRYYGLPWDYDVVSLDGADNFFSIQLIKGRTVTILSFNRSLTSMTRIVCSSTLACYVAATQHC